MPKTRKMRGGAAPGTPITNALRRVPPLIITFPLGTEDAITMEPFEEGEEVVVMRNNPQERMTPFTVFKRNDEAQPHLPPRRLDNSDYTDGVLGRIHLEAPAAAAPAPVPAVAPAAAPQVGQPTLIAIRPIGGDFRLVEFELLFSDENDPRRKVGIIRSDEIDPPQAFIRPLGEGEQPTHEFRTFDTNETVPVRLSVNPDDVAAFIGGRKRRRQTRRRGNRHAKKTRKH